MRLSKHMSAILKPLAAAVICGAVAVPAASAYPSQSILDIKHSLTDDNIVPPESFETKIGELEENFYLQNYVVRDKSNKSERLGTAKDYEKRLASLPTEIEMPYNDVVGKMINMYLGKRRGLVADMLALHSYYGNIFLEELLKEGMPTELQYLPVIESALNPNAVSRAGAGGLWQFMPGTAKGLGMEVNSLVDERRDPRASSRNAARYLHQLYDIYGDWSLAIAAYNCGPGNVNKALRRAGGGKKDFWEIYNYLPRETRGYVPAFIAANYVMNFYDHHNISPTVVRRHLTTDTVTVNHRVHLQQIADVLNIPIDEIRMLNPQFRKDIIPGNYRPYMLTLPRQQVLSYLMSEDAILAHDAELYAQRTYVEPGTSNESAEPVDIDGDRNLTAASRQSANADQNHELAMAATESVSSITHVVGRGENIKDIAKKYDVSATDIKRWNKLRRGKVKEGDRLVIETRRMADPESVTAVASTTTNRKKDSAKSSDVPRPKAKQPKPEPAAVPEPPAKKTKEAPESEGTRAGRRYAQHKEDYDRPQGDVSNPRQQEKQQQPARSRKQQTAAPEKTSGKNKSNAPEQTSSKKKSRNTAAADNKSSKKKNSRTSKKQSKPKEYTVKEGDNLDKIARRNGTTVEELRRANGMKKNETMIKSGQNLKIPSKNSGSKRKSSKGNSSKKKSKKR